MTQKGTAAQRAMVQDATNRWWWPSLIEQQSLPAGAWQPEEIVTRPSHDSLVKRAMLAIEQNIAVNTPLSELAESLGISSRQLQRRFEDDIGISVRDTGGTCNCRGPNGWSNIQIGP